jgi:hypothetical protein
MKAPTLRWSAPILPSVLLFWSPGARAGDPAGGAIEARAEELAADLQAGDTVKPDEFEDLREAIQNGKTWLSLRYRFESVEQEGFDKDAYASTLRTVLGYETGVWRKLSGLVEFEDVHAIGFDDSYNSTTNGVTDRPVVLDPEGGELNQALVRYACTEDVTVQGGRQRLTLSNHRFVGNVGWRQNEQTFDGVTVRAKNLGSTELLYGWVTNVNRVTGEDSPVSDLHGNVNLLHAVTPVSDLGMVNAYAYLLDLENAPAVSTQTFGASFDGSRALGENVDLLWWLEAANQTDYADNPVEENANYFRAELGAGYSGVTLKVGNELLGGSGDPGDKFSTPLATLHAFNGWADVFLNTPDAGLNDLYASLGGTVADTNLELVWHEFTSDKGSLDYGAELDFLATRKIAADAMVGFKYADYSADEFGPDTTKAWVWLGWSF